MRCLKKSCPGPVLQAIPVLPDYEISNAFDHFGKAVGFAIQPKPKLSRALRHVEQARKHVTVARQDALMTACADCIDQMYFARTAEPEATKKIPRYAQRLEQLRKSFNKIPKPPTRRRDTLTEDKRDIADIRAINVKLDAALDAVLSLYDDLANAMTVSAFRALRIKCKAEGYPVRGRRAGKHRAQSPAPRRAETRAQSIGAATFDLANHLNLAVAMSDIAGLLEIAPSGNSLPEVCDWLISCFSSVEPGHAQSEAYKRLAGCCVELLFLGQLVDSVYEWRIEGGDERIDVLFSNLQNEGFFSKFAGQCVYVPLEAKNLSGEIADTELSQIESYCRSHLMFIGLLACRGVLDTKKLARRCKKRLAGKIILVLCDDDFKAMLKVRVKPNWVQEIHRFMLRKLREIAAA